MDDAAGPDPVDVVRRGYDTLSWRYRGDEDHPAQYQPWIGQWGSVPAVRGEASVAPPPRRPREQQTGGAEHDARGGEGNGDDHRGGTRIPRSGRRHVHGG